MTSIRRVKSQQAALNKRLERAQLVPAFDLDLPSFKGRPSQHEILRTSCASHEVSREMLTDVAHPLAGMNAARYVLFRAVPKSPPPQNGWPILYLLDGNAAFDFLTVELLAQVPDLVIIGVGYDTSAQFERASRARDLTFPAKGQEGLAPEAAYGDRLAGGAPQFMSLLKGPLRAIAEAGLQIDPTRRTLWGHSLGGLFTLMMMLKAPQSFARFAAISPSLWLNPERLEEAFKASSGGQNLLYLGSGNREKRSFTDGPEPTDAPEAFYVLIDRLLQKTQTEICWQVYDGAVHIASLPSSLEASLNFAAADL